VPGGDGSARQPPRAGAVFQERANLKFFDFCSGLRAPLSFALAWCGWEVRAFDIELGTDLAGDKHAELWTQQGEVLARAWACPCSTFSRAREKRLVYSSDGGPPLLRSDEHPKGIAGLSPRDQARVDVDTTLACRAAEWAEHSLADGLTLTLIENPRHSLLWALPEQQRLQLHDSWCSVDYDACCFQGARKKAQTIRGNTSLLSQLSCKCSHVHTPMNGGARESSPQLKRKSTRPTSPTRWPYASPPWQCSAEASR
jgi:hypothetical protein